MFYKLSVFRYNDTRQASKRKDGQARTMCSKIINAYLEKKGGRYVERPDHVMFQEIKEQQEQRFNKDLADGAFGHTGAALSQVPHLTPSIPNEIKKKVSSGRSPSPVAAGSISFRPP